MVMDNGQTFLNALMHNNARLFEHYNQPWVPNTQNKPFVIYETFMCFKRTIIDKRTVYITCLLHICLWETFHKWSWGNTLCVWLLLYSWMPHMVWCLIYFARNMYASLLLNNTAFIKHVSNSLHLHILTVCSPEQPLNTQSVFLN